MLDPAHIGEAIGTALARHGFEGREHPASIEGIEWLHLWVRKTWNTNRAVVILRLPNDPRPVAQLSHQLKAPIGKVIKYIPFLYGLGLQIVWVGDDVAPRATSLQDALDAIDNQTTIVQSVFVVDLTAKTHTSARTWGQVITGKFQDAIEGALKTSLSR